MKTQKVGSNTIKYTALTLLLIICLTVGVLLQVSLLESNRGQGMGMPFLIIMIFTVLLFVVYILFIICDHFLKKDIWMYITILVQTGIFVYTVYKYSYNYDFIHNWDKSKYGHLSDYFPPGDESYWIVGFYILLVTAYCIRSLHKRKRLSEIE